MRHDVLDVCSSQVHGLQVTPPSLDGFENEATIGAAIKIESHKCALEVSVSGILVL